jgi:endonuclease/exonuclease/phosphatase family metal-dependent hydrolase
MRRMARTWIVALALTAACASEDTPPELTFVAVTFNTGTTMGLGHDDPPDDGYGSDDAAISDMWYGDGLAWPPAIEATRAFFAEVAPDIVAFQEIFHAGDCAGIPSEHHVGFLCETYVDGAPTVAEIVVGGGYQVACHLGKADKCVAVKRSFGTFRGCTDDLCLDGLDGAQVPDCGSGSRVGRGVIQLAVGGELTVVNLHGSSGLTEADRACRVAQIEQVFLDLDGEPGANGGANVVLGDLNTDPARFALSDESARRFSDFVGPDHAFHYITDAGESATPTYGGVVNIDHVVSDVYQGSCWTAGISAGHPAVTDAVYFDHAPAVCTLEGDLP